MDKSGCCCCWCVHFTREKKCTNVCAGQCKGMNIVCACCSKGTINCEQFECKYPLKSNIEIKEDYYNGRSCLSHIENFFVFHDFLSHYETFYIGNIIKYLWRYKKKNGVKDLIKAKQYLDFLINEQERTGGEEHE